MGQGTIIAAGGMDTEETFWGNMKEIFALISSPVRLAVFVVVEKAEQEAMFGTVIPKRIEDWKACGVQETHYCIINEMDSDTGQEIKQWIHWADMVAIMGGDTREYYKHFCRDEVAAAIKEANQIQGKPVLGVSAGALILSSSCIIWGSEVKDLHDHPYAIQSNYLKDQWNDGDVGFRMGSGLGLLDGVILDVHCTQCGRIPRLIKAVAQHTHMKGVGLDADACILVTPDSEMRSFGKGLVSIVDKVKIEEDSTTMQANITVMLCGQKIDL